MFVLTVGFEADGEGSWPQAEAVGPSLLTVNVGNEAEMLAALDLACFDAIVIDLDRPASWMFDLIKLERFANAADAGPPAIGCASAIDQPLRDRCSDAGIRVIVDKPVNATRLCDHLQRACGAAAALGA